MHHNRSAVLCATHFHELTSFFDGSSEGGTGEVSDEGSGEGGVGNCVVDAHGAGGGKIGVSSEAMDCTPNTLPTTTSTSPTIPATSSIVNMHASAHIDTVQNSITMLYEILPGPANHSYGIHVAKIAHFPDSIIQQARLIEEQLLHA